MNNTDKSEDFKAKWLASEKSTMGKHANGSRVRACQPTSTILIHTHTHTHSRNDTHTKYNHFKSHHVYLSQVGQEEAEADSSNTRLSLEAEFATWKEEHNKLCLANSKAMKEEMEGNHQVSTHSLTQAHTHTLTDSLTHTLTHTHTHTVTQVQLKLQEQMFKERMAALEKSKAVEYTLLLKENTTSMDAAFQVWAPTHPP